MPIIKPAEYAARRQRLLKVMGKAAIAILYSGNELIRNGDSHFPFRVHSDFYYLTGFAEPEAYAVLIPGREEGEYLLFNRPRDLALETWHGRRAGQVGACEIFGADQAFTSAELPEKFAQLLLNCDRVYYPIGRQSEVDVAVMQAVEYARNKNRAGYIAPLEFISLEHLLHEMRLFKSPAELAALRQASTISVAAHRRAMANCRSGWYEYQLEAELRHEFIKHGSQRCAYSSIVGGGENACILHYAENNAMLNSGDLVLLDAGCEYENYAADITSTFPVNGRFTPEQRAIYEVVLTAQLAVIAAIKPGLHWDAIHVLAVQKITEGLVALGLLKGQVAALIANKAYTKFFMHQTGHFLGLDVHDVGSYKLAGAWRTLQPGMVFTVEPGIYIPPNTLDVAEKWWGIGVRIEDDVVITATGCEVLTAGLPRTVAAIEALVGQG